MEKFDPLWVVNPQLAAASRVLLARFHSVDKEDMFHSRWVKSSHHVAKEPVPYRFAYSRAFKAVSNDGTYVACRVEHSIPDT